MTEAAALKEYFNSFGIPAYPNTSVPENAAFPFMTYEAYLGRRGQEAYPMLRIWHHTESESELNRLARNVSEDIGGGVSIKCDTGSIQIYQPEPWTPTTEASDASVKSRYTTLKIAFNTY